MRVFRVGKEFLVLLFKFFRKSFRIFRSEGLRGIKHRLNKLSGDVGKMDQEYLSLSMNRIYDMPEIEIDEERPETVNVLVPAFDFSSISAGFFGVFQAALFIKRQGFNVRLVMFDNFYFNYQEARKKFENYPGLETLFDELEVEYIGERKAPLKVSANDTSLATVWYSAYFAQKIQKICDGRPFLYLIQDYETNFYAGSTNSILAEQTYKMNYHAMFSTKTLQDHFINHNIGGIKARNLDYIYYDNCCSSSLPTFTSFQNNYKNAHRRKLVFYSRPVVNRNMYELGALVIIEAIKRGILSEEEWDFYGIGLGSASLKLTDDRYLYQMPRMNLKDYMDSISGYDIGVTLMASPHPSLLPFDLAGSGCVVVTNNCFNKDQSYFDNISGNIISREPDLNDLLDGIAEAVKRVPDLKTRYANAVNMNFPKTWEETWTDEHQLWVKDKLMYLKKKGDFEQQSGSNKFVKAVSALN